MNSSIDTSSSEELRDSRNGNWGGGRGTRIDEWEVEETEDDDDEEV